MPSVLSSAIHFANQIKQTPHAICLASGDALEDFLQCIEQMDAKAMIFLMRIMQP